MSLYKKTSTMPKEYWERKQSSPVLEIGMNAAQRNALENAKRQPHELDELHTFHKTTTYLNAKWEQAYRGDERNNRMVASPAYHCKLCGATFYDHSTLGDNPRECHCPECTKGMYVARKPALKKAGTHRNSVRKAKRGKRQVQR